jgi:hypothetical protein
MNTFCKYILALALSFGASAAHGQKDLHVNSLFRDYGRQHGAIMIELARDVLGNHTKIGFYKSMTVPAETDRVQLIEETVRRDVANGVTLMEYVRGGRIEKAYYLLERSGDATADYEYILFTNKSGRITLIYVTGNFTPAQLTDELDKLKDLFIKVNNKHIKLN